MTEKTFKLIPFPAPDLPVISLTGKLFLKNNALNLYYSLSGDMKKVLVPVASLHPSRKDELWKETCFEFFLAIKDEPGYWEFNFSPSGDWNVYRMDAYRRVGFREELAISELPIAFQKVSNGYSLVASIDLVPLTELGWEFQVAIAAIVQTQDGTQTYWALTHPAPQADFHHRESFVLELAEQTHPSPESASGG